mgnify:CR=1 FL=1
MTNVKRIVFPGDLNKLRILFRKIIFVPVDVRNYVGVVRRSEIHTFL